MLRQGIQNISLDVSNVLLLRLRFKQKPAPLCAESVDGSNSLWKALEKRNEFDAGLRSCAVADRNDISQCRVSGTTCSWENRSSLLRPRQQPDSVA